MERLWRRVEWFTERTGLADVWDGPGARKGLSWRLLTLTMPRPADPWKFTHLRSQVLRARKAWGELWRGLPWGKSKNYVREDGRRSKRKRRDTAFAMGIEIGPSGNVHVHVAVFGEYIPQRTIAARWRDALGYTAHELEAKHGTRRLVVHVTGIRAESPDDIRDALREVLKYTAKGQKGAERYDRAAMIERAFKHVRRVEMGGALRQMPEVTRQELALPPRACPDCASQAGYAWLGITSAVMVLKNGGFGPVRPALAAEMAARSGYAFDGAPPPWHCELEDDDDPQAIPDEMLAQFETFERGQRCHDH